MIYILLSGAIMMATFMIALFFLKFWKKTGDRLFVIFSIAFFLLSAERMILGFIGREPSPYVYFMRLLAFCFILFGIIDKNRSGNEDTSNQ